LPKDIERIFNAKRLNCTTAPWWTAPVIIGGSGGSGTRGSDLLVQELGVAMACEHGSISTTTFEVKRLSRVSLGCNKANDFSLTGDAAGHPSKPYLLQQSFLRQNGSYVHKGPCTDDSVKMGNGTGFADTKWSPTALAQFLAAVRPERRRALRWGFKGPKVTYMLNMFLRLFPCLAFIDTLRDINELVRESHHSVDRVTEAFELRMIHEAIPSSLPVIQYKQLQSLQRFYASHPMKRQAFLNEHIFTINSRLAAWARRCMLAGHFVSINIMRLSRCLCASAISERSAKLASSLRLDAVSTHRKVLGFLRKERGITQQSHSNALTHPLLIPVKGMHEWPTSIAGPPCYC